MKRHAIALLMHPYKNRLIPPSDLRTAIDRFAENTIDLVNKHPHLRLNCVLPGYILESIDPLLLSKLRDISKRGSLEWLLTGYTEPFLSFSPQWLTIENIRHGLQVFLELTGETPSGLLPAFSNWEPAYLESLRSSGLMYAVLSGSLLPHEAQPLCGYWTTEHAGSSMALFFSYTLHHYTVPADITEWVENIFSHDPSDQQQKLIVIEYLVPLDYSGDADPYKWLEHTAAEIDKRILNYQTIRLQEQLGSSPALGLQFIPPSLPLLQQEFGSARYFLNQLLLYDQVGILQRKLMETCDQVQLIKEVKTATALKRRLFFLQDINRYLPHAKSGFTKIADRLWTYGRLIDIDRDLHERNNIQGGQIRISDFLRNGSKSIIMSNKSLKVYIDHKNGGHIFEMDYRDRKLNLCAAYNPVRFVKPDIVSPGNTRTSFADHLFPEETKATDFATGAARELGNFLFGNFDYKVKKTSSGVKTILTKQGSVLKGDRNCPLSMEKVFGLDSDVAELSFVYQFSNHSLTTYSFKFAIELALSFPGTASSLIRLTHGKAVHENLGRDYVSLEQATKWMIEDRKSGVRMQFVTQKPVDVWCLPATKMESENDPPNGITVVMCSNISLVESSAWKLMGKLVLKRFRTKELLDDAI